jgi:hypothetical protein
MAVTPGGGIRNAGMTEKAVHLRSGVTEKGVQLAPP